jgi:hypothetical protein
MNDRQKNGQMDKTTQQERERDDDYEKNEKTIRAPKLAAYTHISNSL